MFGWWKGDNVSVRWFGRLVQAKQQPQQQQTKLFEQRKKNQNSDIKIEKENSKFIGHLTNRIWHIINKL